MLWFIRENIVGLLVLDVLLCGVVALALISIFCFYKGMPYS